MAEEVLGDDVGGWAATYMRDRLTSNRYITVMILDRAIDDCKFYK